MTNAYNKFKTECLSEKQKIKLKQFKILRGEEYNIDSNITQAKHQKTNTYVYVYNHTHTYIYTYTFIKSIYTVYDFTSI